jgi:hypothetical protein
MAQIFGDAFYTVEKTSQISDAWKAWSEHDYSTKHLPAFTKAFAKLVYKTRYDNVDPRVEFEIRQDDILININLGVKRQTQTFMRQTVARFKDGKLTILVDFTTFEQLIFASFDVPGIPFVPGS